MRQWLDAGYFKGDLPVSQNPSGPFRSLLSIFPDPSVAFHADKTPEEEKKKETPSAKIEVEEPEKVEVEKEVVVEEPEVVKEESEPEPEPAPADIAAISSGIPSSDQNASSVQLKMLLGLGTTKPTQNEEKIEKPDEVVIAGPPEEPEKEEKVEPPPEPQPEKPKRSKKSKPATTPVKPPSPPPAPAPVAWGGAATNKQARKKSMSEIQQEEARVSAILAKERSISRSSSGGWANVAASGGGSSGWSSGAVKQSTPVLMTAAPQAKAKSQPMNQKLLQQQNQQRSNSQSKAVDDFGATMTPALESWCKEKMQKLTGSDDLTLVSSIKNIFHSSLIKIRYHSA